MRDDFDAALSSLIGARSNYTMSEIEEAQKLKKRNGGTLLDNLEKVTGRGLPSMNTLEKENSDIRKFCEDNGIDIDVPVSKEKADLDKELDAFSKELKSFGNDNDDKKKTKSETHEVVTGDEALKGFIGINTVVEDRVFGQEAFIKKLVIAFKRPFVLEPEAGRADNCIFITGPKCSGKHYALKTLVEELEKRKIFKSGKIRTMDLSLYPSASEEKLFLQDLYSALSCKSKVILFEHFEECHPSLMTRLAQLVITGKCTLSERYVLKDGQLINVTNALASDTIGAFSAKGKYLVFISPLSLEKLADAAGAPFVNALGDVCESKKLEEDALLKVAKREEAELELKASKQLKFEIDEDENFVEYSTTMAGKQAGLQGILDFYDDVLKALAQLRLERDFIGTMLVKLTVEDNEVYATIGESKNELLSVLPGRYTGELQSVRKEMDSIVGLSEIKDYVMSLEEYYSVQKRRREAGLKAKEVNKHMIFTGNPGTGKTTIARIISRYLKAIGVLTGGQLVEVSRADLVGKYVGHTAPLTNQVINSAIGGVLFIDEAYSLYRGKDDSFGLEAIDTLVKGIEDNRDNLIVILAGYSDEMEEFLTANSGLKSRFPNIVNFPDYTGKELLEIAKIQAKSMGYVIDEGAYTPLNAYFNAVQAVRAKDAGNGRLVRNKVEEAVLNQSKRLAKDPSGELCALLSEDFNLSDVNG